MNILKCVPMSHYTVEFNLGRHSQLQTVQTQLLRFSVSPLALGHTCSKFSALLLSKLSFYWKIKRCIPLPTAYLKASSFVSRLVGSPPKMLWTIWENGVFMLDYVINAKNVSCLCYWHYLQYFLQFHEHCNYITSTPHSSSSNSSHASPQIDDVFFFN